MSAPATELVWHHVPFAGERAVTEATTWGQRLAWRDLHRMPPGSPYNVTQPLLAPPGTTLPQILDCVAEVAARYESLRTVFRPDSDGVLRHQTVLDRGEVLVAVWTGSRATGTGGDPVVAVPTIDASGAAELDAWFERSEFDHATDVPFRVMVIAPGGSPMALVLCATHLAADLQSARFLAEELERLLTACANGQPQPPVRPALQPVEVAREEACPRGTRQSAAAVAYLRDRLTAFPMTNFAHALPPSRPRYWKAALDSYATGPALEVLAGRHGVGTSIIALAAATAVLGAASGSVGCAMLLVVGNRAQSDMRYAVGTLTQHVPALFPLTGTTFADHVAGVWTTAMRAYRRGRFDPLDGWAATDEVVAARGGEPELDCFFNDMRPPADGTGDAPVASVMPAEFHWEESRHAGTRFFLELGTVFGRPDVLRWTLLVDTCAIPRAGVEPLLRGLERLLVTLVDGDLAMTDVTRVIGGMSPTVDLGTPARGTPCPHSDIGLSV